MGLYSGYGADVIMKLKGVYTIRTKIALEGGRVHIPGEVKVQTTSTGLGGREG
jgi:hypothetical protein